MDYYSKWPVKLSLVFVTIIIHMLKAYYIVHPMHMLIVGKDVWHVTEEVECELNWCENITAKSHVDPFFLIICTVIFKMKPVFPTIRTSVIVTQ